MPTGRSAYCGPCKAQIAEGEPRYFHKTKRFVTCEVCASKPEEAVNRTKPPEHQQQQVQPAQSSNLVDPVLIIENLFSKYVAGEFVEIATDVKAILKRIEQLETQNKTLQGEITSLKYRVTTLQQKANAEPAYNVKRDSFGEELLKDARTPMH